MVEVREIRTEEVDITIRYDAGMNGIMVSGSGDLRHHLIEELIFGLADMFEMEDHLGVIWRKIKARSEG